MNDELLIESVLSAHRERGPGGVIREHPAWHDLGPDGRAEAHERTRSLRMLEAALDPEGLSSTARAVLPRTLGSGS